MRRNALTLAGCVLVLTLGGCGLFGRKNAPDTLAVSAPMDPYPVTAVQPQAESDPYAYAAPIEPTEPVEATRPPDPYPSAAAGSRYHTVAKADTLYSLARRYYGEQGRWKDIYEANRTEIRDPNMIRIGQQILIP